METSPSNTDKTGSHLLQVKASAGSGKTFQLTRQFLSLLQRAQISPNSGACAIQSGSEYDGYAWNEILAVTFTNKAAQEMRSRLLKELKKRALGLSCEHKDIGPDRESSLRLLTMILRRMSLLQARTIDSLLHQIVRLSALSLKLPPDFEPVFDLNDIYDDIYDAFISKAANGDAKSLELLRQAYGSLLKSGEIKNLAPAQALKSLLLPILKIVLDTRERLATDPEFFLTVLGNCCDDLKTSARDMLAYIEKQSLEASKNFRNCLEKCCDLQEEDEAPGSVYLAKASLAECLNKSSKSEATPEGEELYKKIKSRSKVYAELQPLLSKAAAWTGLVALAQNLAPELEDFQRRAGLVLQQRMTGYVQELLDADQGLEQAYCRMGASLCHLLLDEFQDTSLEQWRAMMPLAEEVLSKGGQVFYVGDVKQAIYAWRGGDARLFEAVAQEPRLLTMVGKADQDTLQSNWRSSRAVIEFNNKIFSRFADPEIAQEAAQILFAKADDSQQAELAKMIAQAYSNSSQTLPPYKNVEEGFVRLANISAASAEELETAVLERLGDLMIQEILPLRRPGEVAVLTRSHSEAQSIAQTFVDLGIPFVTESSLLLSEHPLIRQTVAFLGYLDYPDSDLSLMEAMNDGGLFFPGTAPEAEELHDWLAAQTKSRLHTSFKKDFHRFYERFIRPFFNMAGLMSPYDLVQELWRLCSVFERHPSAELYLRRFLEIVHAAEDQGKQSLASFLDFWKEESLEEKVPLPEGMDAVRILTIHKAKGLEYPVVVVPFHLFDFSCRNTRVVWRSPDIPAPCLVPLMPEMKEGFLDHALPLALEPLNLLYVAWTRAREELYAFITRREKSKPAIQRILERVLHDLGLSEDGDEYELGARPDATGRSWSPAAIPEQNSKPDLPEEPFHPMDWLPRLKMFRSALEPEAFNERKRGALAHRCLEHLSRLPVSLPLDQAITQAVQLGMLTHDDPHDPAGFSERSTSLENEITAMLRWAAGHPEVKPLLRTGRPEQEILDAAGNIRRADFVAVSEDCVTVLEYKTGRPADEHKTQLLAYLDLLSAMPGHAEKPVKGFLVYLDQRHVIPLQARIAP